MRYEKFKVFRTGQYAAGEKRFKLLFWELLAIVLYYVDVIIATFNSLIILICQ